MKKIKCLIIDDEPLALDLIERYVKQTPFLELVGRCYSCIEAMQVLHEETVDLIFLDIQMHDMTGIEFSKTLRNGPKFIFTTAYEEYALMGFKLDALDYLLKPFNYEEFVRTAQKARDLFDLIESSKERNVVSSYIFVKSEYKLIKIDLKEVLYIEGLKDYIKIHFDQQKTPVMSLMSVKAIEEQLPAQDFMRIHRSYIVHLHKIDSIERGKVKINDVYVPVADNYKQKFQEFITKNTH